MQGNSRTYLGDGYPSAGLSCPVRAKTASSSSVSWVGSSSLRRFAACSSGSSPALCKSRGSAACPSTGSDAGAGMGVGAALGPVAGVETAGDASW